MEGTKIAVYSVLCTFAIICLSTHVAAFRTCAEARYCCPGRNNTCFAFGPRMDRDPNETRCFCDQNCAEMGDCCIDYKETCEGKNGTVRYFFSTTMHIDACLRFSKQALMSKQYLERTHDPCMYIIFNGLNCGCKKKLAFKYC